MMKKQLLSMAVLMATTLSASAQQLLPYQNPNLSAEARANDLLFRLTLEEKTKLMMDTSPAIARLGIPQFQWWNEALHGVGRNGFVTVFPITMHMAASWDDTLLYKVFTAVSDEARAKAQEAKKSGNIKRYQSLSFWTPNINIFFASHRPIRHSAVPVVERGAARSGAKRICYRFPYHDAHGCFVG